jgi:hypothetical protein
MTTSTSTIPTITYDGALKGVTRTHGEVWCYEGREYDTPADEPTLVDSVGEALTEPDVSLVEGARKLVFGGSATYTSQVLLAMATAYESECDGGDGSEPVAAVLREAARRVAVIEALTM